MLLVIKYYMKRHGSSKISIFIAIFAQPIAGGAR